MGTHDIRGKFDIYSNVNLIFQQVGYIILNFICGDTCRSRLTALHILIRHISSWLHLRGGHFAFGDVLKMHHILLEGHIEYLILSFVHIWMIVHRYVQAIFSDNLGASPVS
jgi:hypothetical protein